MKTRIFSTFLFIFLIILFTFSGIMEKLFYMFRAEQALFQLYCQQHFVWASLLFMLIFLIAATLCLPMMSLLMLAAGALFPFYWAILYSSFGLSLGACGAFLFSRYWFGAVIEKKFGSRLEKFHANFILHGDYYLMSLRLSPLIPYWMINIFMGLTRVKLWKFYLFTQIGTFVFVVLIVNAGAQLSSLESLSDLLSTKVWLSLLLLGFVPLVLRYLMVKKSRS